MSGLTQLRKEQPHPTGMLRAALTSGRLHHAYMLVCQDAEPAHRFALGAAQALVCQEEPEGCQACPDCRHVQANTHPDVLALAANEKNIIPIDVVRELSARLSLRAARAQRKVVIVRDADRMRPEAQNALLKTLEEPPGPSCFFLLTPQRRALLPTVRSRCVILPLRTQRDPKTRLLLEQSGIPPAVAGPLAAIAGPDIKRAKHLEEQGAVEIAALVRTALERGTSAGRLIEIAADLGADEERFSLATSVLLVALRDALARAHGVPPAHLFGQIPAEEISWPPSVLVRVASRLAEVQRRRVIHANRTMSLEYVLLACTQSVSPSNPLGS